MVLNELFNFKLIGIMLWDSYEVLLLTLFNIFTRSDKGYYFGFWVLVEVKYTAL